MDETKMISMAILGIVAFIAVIGLIVVESSDTTFYLGGRGRRYIEDTASSDTISSLQKESYLGTRGRRYREDSGDFDWNPYVGSRSRRYIEDAG